MEKNYIYIVLTRTNTTISKLIHLIKKDEYTHASISLDKDLSVLYSFGRKYTHYPFIGRFMIENINKGVYKSCNKLPGAIIKIEVSEEEYKKVKRLLNYFISNRNHYKYNYRGLYHSLLNKPVSYEDRFLCSEFVYYILNESGIVDFKIPRNLVRPQSFLDVEGKLTYKGDLKKLIKNNRVNSKVG